MAVLLFIELIIDISKLFRLTYGYKLVGMMPYEKLAQRDIDQLRFPIRDCTTALTPEEDTENSNF